VESLGKTQRFDGYARWKGTSFSAAIVAGTIAARIQPGVPSAAEVVESMVRWPNRRDNAGRPYVPAPNPYGQ
jgi:subtilisin family serine protease